MLFFQESQKVTSIKYPSRNFTTANKIRKGCGGSLRDLLQKNTTLLTLNIKGKR